MANQTGDPTVGTVVRLYAGWTRKTVLQRERARRATAGGGGVALSRQKRQWRWVRRVSTAREQLDGVDVISGKTRFSGEMRGKRGSISAGVGWVEAGAARSFRATLAAWQVAVGGFSPTKLGFRYEEEMTDPLRWHSESAANQE